MKRFYFSLIVVLCFLFISCGGDIMISIFTRDLSDVMNSREEVLYTNVNMIVEGLEDENDIEFLRRNLNGFSNEHKVDYNYSTSLSFDFQFYFEFFKFNVLVVRIINVIIYSGKKFLIILQIIIGLVFILFAGNDN